MSTQTTVERMGFGSGQSITEQVRATSAHSYMLAPRIIAGVTLLGIGLMHALDAELRMRPLVEAADLPLAAVLAPLAVAIEIIAGIALLAGLWARIAALLTISTMLVAIYAHVVIDVWPNGADNEPPLALPIAVMLAAAAILWRGAGRWSFDRRATQ